jgi:DedD protein
MRFEIRVGGWILIFVGLAGLSVVVFALGLFAGYDMASNASPDAPRAASVYPLPSPPPRSDIAKSPAKSSDQVASTEPASPKPALVKAVASSSANSGALSLPMDKNAGPVAAIPSRAVASVAAPIPAPPNYAPSETVGDAKPPAAKPPGANPAMKYALAAAPPAVRHKPFNIQIDAAMDHANAEQMTARLQKLGYRAFMVPTAIGGQTWYRVRIGPYPSQEEASAAEQELRAKYKDAYAP